MKQQRNSTRLGFMLQLTARVFGALSGLVWTRLLIEAMGRPLFGLFLSFQSVMALGGLGDLGMGGAVAIQTGQKLGAGDMRGLHAFLATARAVFLLLALTAGLGFLTMSPWLPGWLKFTAMPGTGSLAILFVVGAMMAALVPLSSYVSNVNYACGNMVWPVVPALLLGQLALMAHWLVARAGGDLWVQALPYFAAAVVSLLLTWFYVRWSHPPLADLRPLQMDRRLFQGLLQKSFWAYLISLGSLIFSTTDRLLINGGFGPGEVPRYQLNNKLCELALFVILTAGYVSLPKISQWLAASNAEARVRSVQEAQRLGRFQLVFGIAAALAYLLFNDLFMRLWIPDAMSAPIAWQAAFAASLAVTAGGDMAIQLSGRISDRGLKLAGSAVGLAGLLNLGLSFASMKAGSITGIAVATVLAQTVLSLVLGRFVCGQLGLSWRRWALRSCLLPLATVGLAATARAYWAPDSWTNAAVLSAIFLTILFLSARGSGFDLAFAREELRQLRQIFGKK